MVIGILIHTMADMLHRTINIEQMMAIKSETIPEPEMAVAEIAE